MVFKVVIACRVQRLSPVLRLRSSFELSEDDFVRLSKAFFTEIEKEYL